MKKSDTIKNLYTECYNCSRPIWNKFQAGALIKLIEEVYYPFCNPLCEIRFNEIQN